MGAPGSLVLAGATAASEDGAGAGIQLVLAHSHRRGPGDSVGRGLRSSHPGPNETFFMHPQPIILNPFLQFSYILSTS